MAKNSTGTATGTAATVSVEVGADKVKRWLYVTNEDGAGRLTFTINGVTATNGGDNMMYVPPVAGAWRRVLVNDSLQGDGTCDVSIIASASTVYNIQVVSQP